MMLTASHTTPADFLRDLDQHFQAVFSGTTASYGHPPGALPAFASAGLSAGTAPQGPDRRIGVLAPPQATSDLDLASLLAQVDAVNRHQPQAQPSPQQPLPSIASLARIHSTRHMDGQGSAALRGPPGYEGSLGAGGLQSPKVGAIWGAREGGDMPLRMLERVGVPGRSWNQPPAGPASHSLEPGFTGFLLPQAEASWQPETPQIFSRRSSSRIHRTPSTGASPPRQPQGSPATDLLTQLSAFGRPEGVGQGAVGPSQGADRAGPSSMPLSRFGLGEETSVSRGHGDFAAAAGRATLSPGAAAWQSAAEAWRRSSPPSANRMSGSGQGERHSEERLAELLRDIEGQKGIQGFPLVQSTEVQANQARVSGRSSARHRASVEASQHLQYPAEQPWPVASGPPADLEWQQQSQPQAGAILEPWAAPQWSNAARQEYRVFQHDSFEPLLVGVSFAHWHLLFYVLDMAFFKSLKRWRIQKSTDMRHWKVESCGRLRGEALWYMMPILLFDLVFPRRKLPEGAPTVLRLSLEVVASLLVYDILFSAAHVAFHKVPWLYKHVHAKHHTKAVQRASETLRLSLPEVVVDTTCSIIALNTVRAHPMSRAAYNIIITYLITELHSGYDAPWMLQNLIPFGLWGGSTKHDQHHRLGEGNYQKFFTFLDRAAEVGGNWWWGKTPAGNAEGRLATLIGISK